MKSSGDGILREPVFPVGILMLVDVGEESRFESLPHQPLKVLGNDGGESLTWQWQEKSSQSEQARSGMGKWRFSLSAARR